VDSVTPDEPRRAPIRWHVATVRDARAESPTARTLVLDVPGWPGHVAGQHVDVRLTAEDGYQAQRSSSIASAPEDATLALTVERLEDGEVSLVARACARPSRARLWSRDVCGAR
jgi:ferredoxin-NADP reductase